MSERWTLGRMRNPVRGFLHGGAAVVSVVGAVLLTVTARQGLWGRFSLLVFGLSLVALFTVSSLYHSVPWSQRAKQRMQRLDHSMIYLLVAGTFTPITWIVLDGWLRVAVLVAQWTIVTVGVAQKIWFPKIDGALSITMQMIQGWIGVLLLVPLSARLPWTALLLIALGGIAYTTGMISMVTGKPRLWPRVFSSHEVFHVLVITGAALHFAVVAGYVADYGA